MCSIHDICAKWQNQKIWKYVIQTSKIANKNRKILNQLLNLLFYSLLFFRWYFDYIHWNRILNNRSTLTFKSYRSTVCSWLSVSSGWMNDWNSMTLEVSTFNYVKIWVFLINYKKIWRKLDIVAFSTKILKKYLIAMLVSSFKLSHYEKDAKKNKEKNSRKTL